MVEKRR